MDSELPSFLVWSLCIKCLVHHEVYSVSWSCLLSFLCNPYIPFQIYEIFYLLVIIRVNDIIKVCMSLKPGVVTIAMYMSLCIYLIQ